MKNAISSAVFFVAALISTSCMAHIGDVRELEDVFAESDTIVYGSVFGSGVGACGGKQSMEFFYIVKVEGVVKGRALEGNTIKACGPAPLLLGNHYVIAGSRYADDEMVFLPDAALLAFTRGRFYRVVAYDSPIFKTDRGEAYGVAVIEPNFLEEYAEMFKSVGEPLR